VLVCQSDSTPLAFGSFVGRAFTGKIWQNNAQGSAATGSAPRCIEQAGFAFATAVCVAPAQALAADSITAFGATDRQRVTERVHSASGFGRNRAAQRK